MAVEIKLLTCTILP